MTIMLAADGCRNEKGKVSVIENQGDWLLLSLRPGIYLVEDSIQRAVFTLHSAREPSDEGEQLLVVFHVGVRRERACNSEITGLVVGRGRCRGALDHRRAVERRGGVGDYADRKTVSGPSL